METQIEKMPEEYKGKIQSKTDYTRTAPRKWTKDEINWILEKKKQGFSNEEIAWSTDRTEVSIQIKLKRLSKDNNSYNKQHVIEKYKTNKLFLDIIEPKTILDLYAGEKPFYSNLEDSFMYDITTNDKNKNFPTTYHKDALECLCSLYANKKKYDFIDLDPFGSAYDCFDLAIKMAKKGISITFGEYGHKRWKRLDYLSRYYDVTSIESFTIIDLINKVIKIGLRNKKILYPVYVKEWQNIARAWFEIKPAKVINLPFCFNEIKEN